MAIGDKTIFYPNNRGIRDTYRNLVIKNNTTNPDFQIDITCDEVVLEDSNNKAIRVSGVSLTNDITISGVNGLDTGTETISMWYHIWIIYNPTTDTIASLLSTSSTSPTLPNGYLYRGLVGALYNDSSSNFRKFNQKDNEVWFQVLTILSGGTATVDTAVSLSTSIPTIAKSATFRVMASGPSNPIAYLRSGQSVSENFTDQQKIQINGSGVTSFIDVIKLGVINNQIFYKVIAGDSLNIVVGRFSF